MGVVAPGEKKICIRYNFPFLSFSFISSFLFKFPSFFILFLCLSFRLFSSYASSFPFLLVATLIIVFVPILRFSFAVSTKNDTYPLKMGRAVA